MKTILFTTITLLIGATAQADIANSPYEARHQALLEKASLVACNVGRGQLTQLSSSISEDIVDQGVVDYLYTTELELVVKTDQNLYDTYKVVINSKKAEIYDIDNMMRGLYLIQSMTCNQK